MQGIWLDDDENGWLELEINDKGRGSLWGENFKNFDYDTQIRGWWIKDDVLYFSRLYNKSERERFVINQYPFTVDSTMIIDSDTLSNGM